jgi:arabinogalactan oligomer / maltooligosaccharide transport system permease protein
MSSASNASSTSNATAVAAPSERRAAADTARAGPPPWLRWLRELGWRYLVVAAAMVFALFPAVWVASAAFNPTGSISGQQLIPTPISTVNFDVLFATPFWRWFMNSMIVAGVTAVGSTFLCALAAYAYSRMRFTGRRASMLALLILQMLPQFLAIIAIFLLMISIARYFPALGLNSLAGLIAIYLGGALGLNTWLMKGFFDTVPRDLDEAAKVDGASHVQVFFTMVLPLTVPILAVVTLLSFIVAINDFIIQSVLLTDDSQFTLAVGLFRFISDDYGTRWGPFAAGALIAGTPIVLLFLFLQRYISTGLIQGAVKG